MCELSVGANGLSRKSTLWPNVIYSSHDDMLVSPEVRCSNHTQGKGTLEELRRHLLRGPRIHGPLAVLPLAELRGSPARGLKVLWPVILRRALVHLRNSILESPEVNLKKCIKKKALGVGSYSHTPNQRHTYVSSFDGTPGYPTGHSPLAGLWRWPSERPQSAHRQ